VAESNVAVRDQDADSAAAEHLQQLPHVWLTQGPPKAEGIRGRIRWTAVNCEVPSVEAPDPRRMQQWEADNHASRRRHRSEGVSARRGSFSIAVQRCWRGREERNGGGKCGASPKTRRTASSRDQPAREEREPFADILT
jgi:hypothetical protein